MICSESCSESFCRYFQDLRNQVSSTAEGPILGKSILFASRHISVTWAPVGDFHGRILLSCKADHRHHRRQVETAHPLLSGRPHPALQRTPALDTPHDQE